MRLSRALMLFGLPAILFADALSAPAEASAQDPADRYGAWRMQSDAPPPSINIMTYEPYQSGGMRVTVESTNASGQDNKWGYVTLFDGEFRDVDGQEGSDTAVEFVDEKTTRITNRRNGRVTQVIINTLSEDGNSISNEYVRFDSDGKIVSVGHAIYERIR